jgi:TIM-barrel protein
LYQYKTKEIKSIKVLAPMAGITNGDFALKLIPYGFDVVTIGGYNVDASTISAGKEILKRGRNEFNIEEKNLLHTIENEVNLIKDKYPETKVSLNLRATTPEAIINFSKVKNLDIIEVNCHCRQKELLSIGCGQAMLSNLQYLNHFIEKIVEKVNKKQKVSVKIRANVDGIDTINVAKIIEKAGASYLHFDAMKPGKPYADLEIINKIATETDIFIIGNNSITDVESGKKMLEAGASGISVGRAAINGKLNFNIADI